MSYDRDSYMTQAILNVNSNLPNISTLAKNLDSLLNVSRSTNDIREISKYMSIIKDVNAYTSDLAILVRNLDTLLESNKNLKEHNQLLSDNTEANKAFLSTNITKSIELDNKLNGIAGIQRNYENNLKTLLSQAESEVTQYIKDLVKGVDNQISRINSILIPIAKDVGAFIKAEQQRKSIYAYVQHLKTNELTQIYTKNGSLQKDRDNAVKALIYSESLGNDETDNRKLLHMDIITLPEANYDCDCECEG